MQRFRADLHTHTVLSPCGSLEMSPIKIIERAKAKGIQLLGITDHNSTLMCRVMDEVAVEQNIKVLTGAEVTTSEEVHCLAFFDNWDALDKFQKYLEENLPDIKNDPARFGHQVTVNRNEEITGEVEKWLITGITQSIEDVEREVHALNGLFIPAHIDRMVNGLIAQLGFIPPDLHVDAMELSKHITLEDFKKEHPEIEKYTVIQDSDAHYPDNIGDSGFWLHAEELTFEELRLALKGENGRKIELL
ncbi:MAG: histidinol-phosphatase [Salinivirgaceae bacterium]|nr:MAG: histidinol-phosphatase [Salinivirgaceae bacterium]